MNRLTSLATLSLAVVALAFTGCADTGDTPEGLNPDAPQYPSYQDPQAGNQVDPAGPAGGTNGTPDSNNPPNDGSNGSGNDGNSGGSNPPAGDPGNGGFTPEEGLNCKGIYDAIGACYETYSACAKACPDEDCAKACEATFGACHDAKVAEGSDTGKAQFSALRACEETHWDTCYDEGGKVYQSCSSKCSDDACAQACGQEANGVLQACLVDNCKAEYTTCGIDVAGSGNDSGNGNGTTPSQNSSCGELYTCEDACNGDQTCGQACYDAATDAAKSEWTSLIQCGMTYCNGQVANAEEYKACLAQLCPTEYETCFFGGGPGNGGGGNNGAGNAGGNGNIETCLDVHMAVLNVCAPTYSSCIEACSNQACADQCGQQMGACIDQQKNAAPAQEGAKFAAVLSCRQANFSSCNSDADAVLWTCDVGCADGDQACLDDCMKKSDEAYEACYVTACATEYATCGITGNEKPGDNGNAGGASDPGASHDSCLAIYEAVQNICDAGYVTCKQGCNDQSCVDKCAEQANGCLDDQVAQGSPEDAADYKAVQSCWGAHYEACYDKGSETYQACMSTCTDGQDACSQACNKPASEAYAECYAVACADEYATCGIQ